MRSGHTPAIPDGNLDHPNRRVRPRGLSLCQRLSRRRERVKVFPCRGFTNAATGFFRGEQDIGQGGACGNAEQYRQHFRVRARWRQHDISLIARQHEQFEQFHGDRVHGPCAQLCRADALAQHRGKQIAAEHVAIGESIVADARGSR